MFPLDFNDYETIENRFQIQINVFGYEIKVYPLYFLKKPDGQTLNLLLISKKDKSHSLFIKDFNRLMFNIETRNIIAYLVYKVLLKKKY